MAIDPRTLTQIKELEIRTASPAKLVGMLWNGIIVDVYQGMDAIRDHQIEVANRVLLHAQQVCDGIIWTLNPEWPPTQNCRSLALFLQRVCAEANIHKNEESIQALTECLPIIETMRDTFYALDHHPATSEGGSSLA